MASLHLVTGQVIDISMTEVVGNEECFSVTYEQLIEDVNQNDHILLDDGLIELTCFSKRCRKRVNSYNC